MSIEAELLGLEGVKRLTRDLAKASVTLSDMEARFLVSAYYTAQENRIGTNNQVRAASKAEEPHAVLSWFADQHEVIENQVKRALDKYTEGHPMGAWMREIYGIGPVISAGLLAYIDITQCPTVGHIERFAGIDPTVKWQSTDKCKIWLLENGLDIEKACLYYGRRVSTIKRFATQDADGNQVEVTVDRLAKALSRRPWNTTLKTLVWKASDSFRKFSGQEQCFYGQIYKQRKALIIQQNLDGKFKEYALERKNTVGRTTEAYKHYSVGMLPPGQIDSRAARHAVKIFLSHLHAKWWEQATGQKAAEPYAIAILGHAHKIEPPHQ